MWLMWFIGWAIIALRVLQTNREMEPVGARLLPEDPETMLRAKDLGPIYQRVNEGGYSEDAFLTRLINRTILQFQSSRSVSQANSILNSTLELCHHEVELRYNGLRFLVWFIPTLGFIGTVLGIAVALNTAAITDMNDNEAMAEMMPTMTRDLGVAFYTTLVALVQSACLVFALHVTQAREGAGAEPGRPVLPRQPDQPTLGQVGALVPEVRATRLRPIRSGRPDAGARLGAEAPTSARAGIERARTPLRARSLPVTPRIRTGARNAVRRVNGGEKPDQRAEQNTATAAVGVRWSEGVGMRPGAVSAGNEGRA